ncbi:hypothetical protein [Hydrogenophaga sp.]|uniref:hypothetical protein n=1 Tax=Hydrogenophaga sp. TaxID=1904254 RepID=UPI00272758BE|nr:hypothetical protein [Hydrogenophaga sp.]MDO8905431.1 hypothetical protein [Hydrogenophaga sp.]
MPLVDEEDEVETKAEREAREDAALAIVVKQLVDRMRHAYWHDDDQMKFEFPEIEKDKERRKPVWIDLRINRLPTFTRELLPDSKWLSKCEVGGNGTDKQARWTDGLRPTDRARLAQALLLIRKEKKAMRAEDLQAEDRHNGCGER